MKDDWEPSNVVDVITTDSVRACSHACLTLTSRWQMLRSHRESVALTNDLNR